MEYDAVIVGTGIGGTTVARERRGKRVVMLEEGGRTDMMGNTWTLAMILRNFGLNRSHEKSFITFAKNYGGLSTLTAGCAPSPTAGDFRSIRH